MTTITQTYAEDTKLALPARARTGGPRRPRGEQPARNDWFERYTTQASYGSHMPLDIRLNWDWLNPLNVIPAFMLLLVLITIVGLGLG
jgi:hypothetical protein